MNVSKDNSWACNREVGRTSLIVRLLFCKNRPLWWFSSPLSEGNNDTIMSNQGGFTHFTPYKFLHWSRKRPIIYISGTITIILCAAPPLESHGIVRTPPNISQLFEFNSDAKPFQRITDFQTYIFLCSPTFPVEVACCGGLRISPRSPSLRVEIDKCSRLHAKDNHILINVKYRKATQGGKYGVC
jgi:hypothetical protein